MIALTKFLSDDGLMALAAKPSQIICLNLENYSPLFCKSLIDFIAKKNNTPIISQAMIADNNIGLQIAGLQSTFLGQNSVYWLHSDAELSKKSSDDWHAFLAGYAGPNTLIFSTIHHDLKAPRSWTVIACPAQADARLFKQLSVLFSTPHNSSFATLLFQELRAVPLDTAIMLHHYGALVGKNAKPFVTDWLPSLAVPEQSLFTLSQTLFARNVSLFFTQWHAVKDLYPLQFWLTFWSEQIWRAYCYIRLQKAGKPLDAKKIGYRLPFSFLQKDWRSHSLDQLLIAHQAIYSLDYQVKQGGSEDAIELFYNKFFVPIKRAVSTISFE